MVASALGAAGSETHPQSSVDREHGARHVTGAVGGDEPDDLDADSLDLVELVMALEETFDVSVDESELEGIETIGQAYDLITAKL